MIDPIQISIPEGHRAEKEYILNVLFNHWFKVPYEIEWSSQTDDYQLSKGGRSLSIPELFFRNKEEGRYDQSMLPQEVHWISETVLDREITFPVYFGDKWIVDRTEDQTRLGVDVFSHVFFQLTRWEEIVINEKDRHSRVQENKLFAVHQGFHKQASLDALITVFVELLSQQLELQIEVRPRYSIKVTHDVDHLRRFDSLKKWISAIGGDLLLRKCPSLVFRTTWEFVLVRLGLRKDNYDTYDELMDLSESIGVLSHFYFMPTYLGEEDARYDIRSTAAKKTITHVKRRGHVVGVHGSYASAFNSDGFRSELGRLAMPGIQVEEGRQHYLRFKNPTTWQIWAANQLKFDSTLGLSRDIGFRCGTAFAFPVFDLVERKTLELVEQPLILMEVPLIREYKEVERCFKEAQLLVDECRRYGGTFVLLWHPENFNHPYWAPYASLYKDILTYASQSTEI